MSRPSPGNRLPAPGASEEQGNHRGETGRGRGLLHCCPPLGPQDHRHNLASSSTSRTQNPRQGDFFFQEQFMPITTTIILGRGEERRVRGGHPWVFSNEIRELRGGREPGAAAEFISAGGEFIGIGYYNPHSLIAGRILTRTRDDIDTIEFFRQRLKAALDYRRACYPMLATFRLVHGEGDLLPGLV